jgi:glucose/arabinose dehydrogenase
MRTPATILSLVCSAVLVAGCGRAAAPERDSGVLRPERESFDRDPAVTYLCDLPAPDLARVGYPYGFCVRRFGAVRAARVMAFAPNGDLFVSSPSTRTPGGAPPGAGQIVVLADDNRDGVADAPVEFAGGVTDVHGLLFADDWLYFTTNDGVFRLRYTAGQRRAEGRAERVADLTNLNSAQRWTHGLARAADGTIYVSVGQYGAYVCGGPPETRAGAVYRLVPGELRPRAVSYGHRNPLYLRCDPAGTTCYAAELSDDSWNPSTGTLGREKLVVIRDREDYGYPCCAGRASGAPPGRRVNYDCAPVVEELRSWPLHDTPFGMDFERGRWPAPYRNGFFVALHGEFTTWRNTKVVWSPLDAQGRPTGEWQDFLLGFGTSGEGVQGRVTDVVFHADGRLFIADDQAGAIYWMAPETLPQPAP